MKQVILNRIAELGGDISQTKGQSLIDDLQNITFKDALHFKDDEPLCDFYNIFYEQNKHLLNNTDESINQAIAEYYTAGDGTNFWQNQLFTPLTPNTPDYDEWVTYFNETDFSQFLEVTGGRTPEFLMLIYSHGYPNHYFICTNDVNQDNPMVFSTDHEVYFDEVENEGLLSDFLNHFMSKQEARVHIQGFLDDVANENDE